MTEHSAMQTTVVSKIFAYLLVEMVLFPSLFMFFRRPFSLSFV